MRLRFLSLYLIITLVFFGIIFASKANAASSSSILVDMVPPNPAPFEDVSISLNSYANNLDNVFIKWSVSNKSVLSGIGRKSFSLKAGAAGSLTLVGVVISLPDGNVETRITIKPAVMVLLWQANDSYVPPFYKGKAMPSPDSEIKVVAMPENKTSSPQNMTYAWKKDYTNDQGASGYGKNFYLYTNDYLEDANNISVVAETIDQGYQSEANIDIGATQPKILFYKNDITIGTMWERTFSNTHKIQGSEIVEAVPYFISPKEIQNPRLIWSWFINDNIINVPSFKKNFMPIRAESGTSGISRLKLEITNKDRMFQTANKEINIEF